MRSAWCTQGRRGTVVISDPTILCLDVGLTHAKAVLFAPDGRLLARAAHAYPTHRPAADRVEQDAEDWWTAIVAACADLRRATPSAMRAVAAVGVTAHMHALVSVGDDGRALGPALVLGDRRARASAEAITAEVGERALYRITGAGMDASMPAAKLRWLRDHDPERFRATRVFLGAKDAIRHRLTGDRLTEPVDACASSLYDIRAGRWSPELLEAVGVDESRLPQVTGPEAVAGMLGRRPAAALGLRPDVPVVVGAGDDVEVLGGGLVAPGEALEHLGTTGSMLAVVDAPVDDPQMALELYPHTLTGRWLLGGSITAAGAAVAWASNLLGYGDPGASLSVLKAPPMGSGAVFLPGLAGERCPDRLPEACGAWVGLDLGMTRGSLMAAAYDGVAMALRRILDALERVAGRQARVVVSAGGSDLDPRWLARRAAVYGRPLVLLECPEPTALGLAVVVAGGVGFYPDVPAAVKAMARRTQVVEPDPLAVESADAGRQRAAAASAALRPIWSRSST